MKGSDIRNLVIVKLEEHSAFLPSDTAGPILSGGDSIDELKPVYSYIDAHLANAANEVLLVAPLHKLPIKDVLASDIEAISLENGVGKVLTPQGFLRLVYFKLSDWSIPVHDVIHTAHPLYKLQHNKYTMGTPQKPVVVHNITDIDGYNSISYYSSKTGEIEAFQYVSMYDEDTAYDNHVAEAIALNCAKKVYEVYGNTEMAGVMQNELTAVLTNMQR